MISLADKPRQVVVGGGTAGIAVAARLSERLPHASVLVIEAGPDAREDLRVTVPQRKGSLLGSDLDWAFRTLPQPSADNRTLTMNRGKVLGGSSALNLLSYDRGVPADYDAWEAFGNDGWNWESMHAAMQQAESFQVTTVPGSTAIATRGGSGHDGPIRALVNRLNPPQQQAFFPTMAELGLQETSGFLNGELLGYMRHTSAIDNFNYTRSYSPDYLDRAECNVDLLLSTQVAKVQLERDHPKPAAKGVILTDGTAIRARKEVILAAGSVQSPQLLELSGIGSKEVLSAAGIEQVVDLPGVGNNLQDHLRIVNSYILKDGYTTVDDLQLNSALAEQQLQRYRRNETSFYDSASVGYAYLQWSQAGYDQAAFIDLASQSAEPHNAIDQSKLNSLKNITLAVPQLEILFNDGYLGARGYPAENATNYGSRFFALIAVVQHPYARGSTHVTSSNATAPPSLNPSYLSGPYDLHAVAMGAKYLRRIAQTPPMRDMWSEEYEPGFDNIPKSGNDDAAWEAYARSNFFTIWHPLGTCAMLPRAEDGVVDPSLRVYGVEGLRVVDASIMPSLVSGHIQTAVYGIAERAAKIIADAYK
ncbi:hypothetical protein MBLNU230_g0713t1 [Neophaeotheca triangularis]